MEIHYCTHFDDEVYAPASDVRAGVLYAGNVRLLEWLEAQLGMSVAQQNTDYLRIELYRQSLLECQQMQQAHRPFYLDSLEADPWATAAVLLSWRDELLLSGWNFTTDAVCPPRLADLVQAEGLFQQKITAHGFDGRVLGYADRFERVLSWLHRRPIALRRFCLHEPEALLLPHLRRLLALLRQWGGVVETRLVTQAAAAGSDLAHWQSSLCGKRVERRPANADGSLRLFRVRRDSDAALFMSEWLARTPGFSPVLLLPAAGNVLEQSMLQYGLPAMGLPSASSARPSLQTLKLAPAFLWEPVDVFKIMEFLTLPLKPFDDGLALEIARVLAEKPGLFSDTWFAAVNDYLEKHTVSPTARKHYEFWFVRRRYPADGVAPVAEVAEIFDYLFRWAIERAANAQHASGLLVLAEQARRVRDVLQVQPNARISRLELERIIRAIHEPAPLMLYPAQVGCLPYVRHPGALAQTAEVLCWWNCANDVANLPADHWRQEERQWLQACGVALQAIQERTQRHLFFLYKPIIQTVSKLIFFLPTQIAGSEAQPTLLWSDLESIFEDPALLVTDLDGDEWNRVGEWPQRKAMPLVSMTTPGTHLHISRPERLGEPACETPTELEQLLYFPHRWFFRRKMRFSPSSLLSIARDQQLLGKLAHRFFELLLREEECLHWDKTTIHQWIEEKATGLLAKEGATLLLYGREPEQHYLLSRVKTAAWGLLECIRTDQWQIHGTEVNLEGHFCNYPMRGRADLVLYRPENEWAIVDLKWSGTQRRKNLLASEEDLQLVLYSYLLPPQEYWVHTAFFIIEDARMIARNRKAFRNAVLPSRDSTDHLEVHQRIFEKIKKTFLWRQEQLLRGLVELRYEFNAEALENAYGNMLDRLEMRKEDTFRDDYYALLWGGE